MKKVLLGLVLMTGIGILASCKWSSEPTPPPEPVVASHMTMIVVHDPLKWTAEQGRLLTNQEFRSYLDQQKHDIRLVYRNQPGEDLVSYFKYMTDAEKKGQIALPYVMISRGGNVVYGGAYPSDVKSAMELVHKYEFVTKGPATEDMWAGGQWRKLGGLKMPEPNLKGRWKGRVYADDTPDEPIIPRDKWVDVDFSYLDKEVLDQDGQSSCCACAAASLEMTLHSICGYEHKQLSVADIYRRGNGGSDSGMALETALDILSSSGVCSTEYADMWSWYRPNYKKGYAEDREKHKVLKAFLCPSLDHIGSAIQRCKPVIIGVYVTSRWQPDANGFISAYHPRSGGGHAIHINGMKVKDGEVYLRIRNSWGKNWGMSGDAWMHESWVELNFGAWTAAVSSLDTDDKL